MRVLITGGTGFLGRHLVWRAAREGCDVRFTGRNADAANAVIAGAGRPVQWIAHQHGTPKAPQALVTAAVGADAIIHCAALSSPWGPWADFAAANIASTAEVIHACQTHSIHRLVHISTPSLYFGFEDRLALREDSSLPKPANDYARSKREAEVLIQAAGLAQVAVLRPRALFGPWDQTLVPRLLRVMKKGPIPLVRNGQIQVDLTYIDNAVDAAWLALTQSLPKALNVYNVSNDEPRPLIEVLTAMAQAFGIQLRTRDVPWWLLHAVAQWLETRARWTSGKEPLLTRYSAGVMAFSQTLDVSALKKDLGWRAQIGIDEGIERHAHWWRRQHG